jgi:hypothetical protein
LLVLIKAIPAIDWPVATGLERDLGLFSALGANRRIHLARAAAIHTAEPLSPTILTAGRAALGFIGITFSREEFLLFYREGERFSTIAAGQSFFCVSH